MNSQVTIKDVTGFLMLHGKTNTRRKGRKECAPPSTTINFISKYDGAGYIGPADGRAGQKVREISQSGKTWKVRENFLQKSIFGHFKNSKLQNLSCIRVYYHFNVKKQKFMVKIKNPDLSRPIPTKSTNSDHIDLSRPKSTYPDRSV